MQTYIACRPMRLCKQSARMEEVLGTLCFTKRRYLASCGPGSVFGIATGYGLDGPGIESTGAWRWPLTPLSRKSRAVPVLPLGPYGLYRASVPVQGCILPFFNLNSWFKQYCVVVFIALGHWRLLPFILIYTYFGVSCFYRVQTLAVVTVYLDLYIFCS